MRIGRRGSLRILCMALVGCLSMAGLVATTAVAKKAKTNVDLEVVLDKTGYTYTVEVTSTKAKCERNRKVTVYHDENGNMELDPGEFVIGSGRTDDDGVFEFQSTAFPPPGDGVGVIVKKTKKCKAGEFYAEVEEVEPTG